MGRWLFTLAAVSLFEYQISAAAYASAWPGRSVVEELDPLFATVDWDY
jgi:hypothetical protein